MSLERRKQIWEHITRVDSLWWKIEDSCFEHLILRHMVRGAMKRGRASRGWQLVIWDIISQQLWVQVQILILRWQGYLEPPKPEGLRTQQDIFRQYNSDSPVGNPWPIRNIGHSLVWDRLEANLFSMVWGGGKSQYLIQIITVTLHSRKYLFWASQLPSEVSVTEKLILRKAMWLTQVTHLRSGRARAELRLI